MNKSTCNLQLWLLKSGDGESKLKKKMERRKEKNTGGKKKSIYKLREEEELQRLTTNACFLVNRFHAGELSVLCTFCLFCFFLKEGVRKEENTQKHDCVFFFRAVRKHSKYGAFQGSDLNSEVLELRSDKIIQLLLRAARV